MPVVQFVQVPQVQVLEQIVEIPEIPSAQSAQNLREFGNHSRLPNEACADNGNGGARATTSLMNLFLRYVCDDSRGRSATGGGGG